MQSSIVSDPPPSVRSSDAQGPLIVFAGGGSGGHLFPGLAIAERIRELCPEAEVLFLCSERRIDSSILSKANETFTPIGAQPLLWRPFPKGIGGFILGWRRAVMQTRVALREWDAPHRSTVMALMGGFVAAPAARAARSLGLSSILLNLDVVPGKANRLAARYASRIVSAVPCPHHPRFCETVVGMPIRRRAVAAESRGQCRRNLDLDPDRLTLLVTGASQGATTFNRLLIDLVASRPRDFDRWQILHLTGEGDFEEVLAAYTSAGVRAAVRPFLAEMAWAWGAADLALSRCGASSVAEAIANRVPTLFSPYPWHRDQHQRLNALEWVEAGMAWLAEDQIVPAENLASLGQELLDLMAHDEARQMARSMLESHPPPDGALTLARLLLDEAVNSIAAPPARRPG